MTLKLSKIFVLLAVFTPLLISRSLFFPFISLKVVFFRITIELALLFFVFFIVFSKDKVGVCKDILKRLRHPIILSAIGFGLVAMVTSFLGVNVVQSFWSNFERGDGAFQILHYIVFFILAFLLFGNKKQIKSLLLVHVGVSILVSFYGLLQLIYATNPQAPSWIIAASIRVSGTLGNPSYLGAYLIFTLATLVYLFLNSKNIGWRVALLGVGVFELFILLKTGTRGAFLGILAAFLVFLVINLFLLKNRKIQILLAVLILIPVLLASAFFTNPELDVWDKIPVLGRLINFRSATTDIQPRIWTWESALAGTIERPLLGWGLENFAEPFDKYYNPKHFGIESFFDRTHNIFLEYTISGGVLLLLCWLLMFWFYYWELFKRKKTLWWSVLFVMPIAYFVQGFFLFDVLAIYLSLFIFLVLFLSGQYKSEFLEEGREKLVGPDSLSYSLIAIVVLLTSLYFSAYLPIRKNLLLSAGVQYHQQTLASPIRNPQEAQVFITRLDRTFSAFERAYEFKSPVGQEETIGSLMKFSLATIERVNSIPALANTAEARAVIKKTVDASNTWFDEDKDLMTGLKNYFLNAVINIQFSLVPTADGREVRVRDSEYMDRGRAMLLEGIEIAPTRVELIRILLRISEIENDEEENEKWLKRAKDLRPDITWETAR